jgi:hypothetical protein
MKLPVVNWRVRVFADGVDLVLLVRSPGVGDEALPIEHQTGIMAANRDGNFNPVVVGLAPVGSRPVRV